MRIAVLDRLKMRGNKLFEERHPMTGLEEESMMSETVMNPSQRTFFLMICAILKRQIGR